MLDVGIELAIQGICSLVSNLVSPSKLSPLARQMPRCITRKVTLTMICQTLMASRKVLPIIAPLIPRLRMGITIKTIEAIAITAMEERAIKSITTVFILLRLLEEVQLKSIETETLHLSNSNIKNVRSHKA